MKGIAILWALLCICITTYAQTIISGQAINAGSRKEIAGVSVTVGEKNAPALLSYAITDAAGAYRLVFKSTADSVVVSASGINLKKQIIVIANKTQVRNFNMPTQAVQLKEIKIAPPKIRQIDDTLNYNVESFTDKNDRTIGEVLRKMPGFTVEENGTIIYNNKPINKFYIENSDLLQGRYNIATNNIEAKDVSTVQVLENHQPVKALKDREFTDEAAINLKLKNSAKGVLVANAQVGVGLAPLLWDNELFTMYFNKKRQNMNTYKGNNTGTDNSADFNSLYAATPDSKPDGRLSVQSPAPPAISRKRYLFNRENTASTNNLWTLGKDLQLTANINFVNDVREKNSASISSYYLPGDQVLMIDETLASSEHINVLNGSLQLNANREKFYLDNALKFTHQWNREQGNVFNPDAVLQTVANPFFEMNNNFSLIKKYNNTNLKVNSTTAYRNAPQTLAVHPFLYPDLFDNPDDFSAMRQTAEQTTFSSVNKFSLGFGNRAFKQTYTAGFDMDLQRFHSTLQAQDHVDRLVAGVDSLSNDLRWDTYKVYLNPEYTYVKKRFRTTLNLPLTYHYLQAHDHGQEVNTTNADKQNNARLYLNPGLNIRYDLNLFWNASASARYNNGFGDIEDGFTGYIMQTYRNLVRNDGRLPQQRMQTYNIGFGYRHPIHAIFLNMSGSYFRNRMNLLYGYDYQDIFIIRKTYDIVNYSDGYTSFLRFSKGIDRLSSTLSVEASYTRAAASQISQEQVMDFANEYYGIKPGFTTKLGKRASLSYSFQYLRSSNTIQHSTGSFPVIHTYTQRARLSFFPAKTLTLNISYENFFNDAIMSGNRSANFADFAAKLKIKKTEFSLGYTNIFNASRFVSASYTNISSFYSVYQIRPAELLLKVRFTIK